MVDSSVKSDVSGVAPIPQGAAPQGVAPVPQAGAPQGAVPQGVAPVPQGVPQGAMPQGVAPVPQAVPTAVPQGAVPQVAVAPVPQAAPPTAAPQGAVPQGAAPTPKKTTIKSAGLGAGIQKKSSFDQKKGKAATGKEAKPTGKMPSGALNVTVTRNDFYRDGFRNLMKIAIGEALIIVAMILSFIIYMDKHDIKDRYFATTADGRIMELVSLDRPNMTRAALMSWVAQAATEVMTFGFHDYQKRLQDASSHFTRRGWESFTTALQKSRIIESVESAQQVVTAVPRSAPILLQEGVFNGKYRWVVELPLQVTYRSGNKSRGDNITVTITIERVPTLESVTGVGIEQWIGA